MENTPYEIVENQKLPDSFGYCENPAIPITKQDYVYNMGLPVIKFDDAPHISIVAKSQSGKTTFISNLIMFHFIH